MKKKLFLFAVVLSGIVWVAQAQIQETFLTVTTSSGTENFSLAGGEVQILNNAVNIVFAENPALNRHYAFDKVTSLSFEQRNIQSGVESVSAAAFKAIIDNNGVLQISAEQALGAVRVYSLAGVLVATIESSDNTAVINLSAQPQGTYIVQAGKNQVKIINPHCVYYFAIFLIFSSLNF
jgi:hypothetical protein